VVYNKKAVLVQTTFSYEAQGGSLGYVQFEKVSIEPLNKTKALLSPVDTIGTGGIGACDAHQIVLWQPHY